MPIDIPMPSAMSLMLTATVNDNAIGRATGFLIRTKGKDGVYLITNRHVVTGRDQNTGKVLSETGGIPDSLTIQHNAHKKLGNWIVVREHLYTNDGQPRWLEHPVLGEKADIVAIPVTIFEEIGVVSYDPLDVGTNFLIEPTTTVSVVGFPFGASSKGGFAVWATGSVASTFEFDHAGLPVFLIDCRSRKGQSGSPVIAYRNGVWTAYDDNTSGVPNGPQFRFLGVYSGRIHSESDLGMVWKPRAIAETARMIAPVA